ncbi:hypothetical protein MNBD_NITROSPINAE02-1296 [hydrothermal vent metagenome]|uniref:DUF3341 domain-containing protein n=1 Tax=hydrothermal vent metagenome TaxID=652676 RepID=A0A3B1CLH9_9ZZZZ
MSVHTVLGLYDHVDYVAAVIAPLEEINVDHHDIKVLTMAPYPHGTFFKDDIPMPVARFAIIGGIIGFLTGLTLAGATQALMNLNVGGKPPVSYPAVGVISYELTLLGTVLGTFIALLWMSGLPNWTERAYDDSISSGAIGLLVRCEDEGQANKIEKTMLRYNPVKVKKGKDDF